MKYYAGIGSRETPADVMVRMTTIARRLAGLGYVLRSGGADGADTAFEDGAGQAKEIWVPWIGFRDNPSTLTPVPDAFPIAEKYHPNWQRCSPAARKLHARNVHQVLGADLRTPVEFVLCWTKDGGVSGGTGQAIRIALGMQIPVYFLNDTTTTEAFLDGLLP